MIKLHTFILIEIPLVELKGVFANKLESLPFMISRVDGHIKDFTILDSGATKLLERNHEKQKMALAKWFSSPKLEHRENRKGRMPNKGLLLVTWKFEFSIEGIPD